MKIHNVVQGSPEWLALRAQHFTASEAAAMMGTSPYMTRSELLRLKHSGIPADIDAATQARFDDGHASEAAARQNVERILQEDLYPSTVTEDVDGLLLLASLDGMNMEGDLIWENKLWSQKIEAMVEAGEIADSHWPQLEQQMLVTGAVRTLFTGSTVDGEIKGQLWYESKPERRKAIIAGWKQFEADLATYTPPEVIPAAVAAPQETLPAVAVQVFGSIEIRDNLAVFGDALAAYVERINKKPETDQDFAELEATVKTLKGAEEALDAAENNALGQAASFDTLRRMVGQYRELARTNRLMIEKLVKVEKENRRAAIVQKAAFALAGHVTEANQRIGKPYMPAIAGDFAGAIKGLKTLSSIQNAVDTELANRKIEANEIEMRIHDNLRALADLAPGLGFLFSDVGQIVTKEPEGFLAVAKLRVMEHKSAEEKRIEAEREKIRAEEQAKMAREQAEAAMAAVAEPTLGQVLHTAAPADIANAFAPQTKQSDTGATLKLGEINARIAPLSINAEGLRALGFRPNQDGAAKVFRECDFPMICAALVRHIQAVANNQNERKAA